MTCISLVYRVISVQFPTLLPTSLKTLVISSLVAVNEVVKGDDTRFTPEQMICPYLQLQAALPRQTIWDQFTTLRMVDGIL